jgi:predicted alpha/beta superfamily hydrolase
MLPSAVLGEPREINVRLPASYATAKADRRYPVLYVLDGGADQDFPHIAGLAQHGEISGTFDEFITVGYRDEEADLGAHLSDEGRALHDLLPGQRPAGRVRLRRRLGKIPPLHHEGGHPLRGGQVPDGGRRVLMGESLAAFFVVDTLLREPKLFHDYVAISPSLWWNREELGDRAGAMLRANDYSDRRLYLTMANEGGTMRRGLDKLLAALRTPAAGALKWTWVDRRASEHHGSLYHLAALDSLRTLYPKPHRPGSPLPWLYVGEMPKLSAAAEADKKIRAPPSAPTASPSPRSRPTRRDGRPCASSRRSARRRSPGAFEELAVAPEGLRLNRPPRPGASRGSVGRRDSGRSRRE